VRGFARFGRAAAVGDRRRGAVPGLRRRLYCDRPEPALGRAHLSTPLFADVPTEMTEEELQIMRSTPGFHQQPKA